MLEREDSFDQNRDGSNQGSVNSARMSYEVNYPNNRNRNENLNNQDNYENDLPEMDRENFSSIKDLDVSQRSYISNPKISSLQRNQPKLLENNKDKDDIFDKAKENLLKIKSELDDMDQYDYRNKKKEKICSNSKIQLDE
jgi:hypothetical protein